MKAFELHLNHRLECLRRRQSHRTRDHHKDLLALQREIELIRKLLLAIRADRLSEAATIKPMTPEQSRKRAERDRKRQQRIADVQATAAQRIGRIRSELGR